MDGSLSWQDICYKYPNQWVILNSYNLNKEEVNPDKASVIAASGNKSLVDRVLSDYKSNEIIVRYTGKFIDEYLYCPLNESP
ncbi:MAG: hypothetical protein ABIA04_01740 [Pseudomonadota bacterium]